MSRNCLSGIHPTAELRVTKICRFMSSPGINLTRDSAYRLSKPEVSMTCLCRGEQGAPGFPPERISAMNGTTADVALAIGVEIEVVSFDHRRRDDERQGDGSKHVFERPASLSCRRDHSPVHR
jgi:hypothetical protein